MSDKFDHLVVTNKTPWQPECTDELATAIRRLEAELPGWWWSVGACHVSADASIGPDRVGPDADLLRIESFDCGFHSDVPQPSTCGEALNRCIDMAIFAKSQIKWRVA